MSAQTAKHTHIPHPAVRVCDVACVRSAGDDATADEQVTGLVADGDAVFPAEIAAAAAALPPPLGWRGSGSWLRGTHPRP